MSNRAKAKGSSFESYIVNYLIGQGFDASRQILTGSKDLGDIKIQGISAAFELKNCVKLDLSGWINQTEIEKQNGNRRWGFTVFKRKGKGKPEEQYVLMTVGQLAELLKELYPQAVKEDVEDDLF